MKGALTAALIALTLPASAHQALDVSGQFDPSYLWFDAPNTTDTGDARIRIVFAGREGAAALTPNQYWRYSQAYKRHLARNVIRGEAQHRAMARARYQAFKDVVRVYPKIAVEGFDLKRTYGDTVLTPDW